MSKAKDPDAWMKGKPLYVSGGGLTWSGKGRQPDWLVTALASGESLIDYLNPTHPGYKVERARLTSPAKGTLEFYMHTAKAVKLEEPVDRVFLVVATGADGVWKTAWKTKLTEEGLVHPGFQGVIPLTQASVSLSKVFHCDNGARPTAKFKPDSLYEKVTLTQLKQRARLLKSVTEDWEESLRLLRIDVANAEGEVKRLVTVLNLETKAYHTDICKAFHGRTK